MFIIIIVIIIPLIVFTLALTDDFPVEFKLEKVSSNIPDTSQYLCWS